MSTNNPNQPATGASAEAQETAPVAAESNLPTSTSEVVNTTAAGENEVANGDTGEMNESFAAILEQHERQRHAEVSEGEVVKGTVEKISDQGVIINIGFKSEGIVPLEEFKEGDQVKVKPGDQVDVLVKQLENNEGYVELSRADAIRMQTWEQIEQAYRRGTTITAHVTDRIKGGLRVDIGGIQAFLPGSQVDIRPVRNLDTFRNKDIEVRVLKVNKKRGNIVLSRKAVLEEQNANRKEETLKHLEDS